MPGPKADAPLKLALGETYVLQKSTVKTSLRRGNVRPFNFGNQRLLLPNRCILVAGH